LEEEIDPATLEELSNEFVNELRSLTAEPAKRAASSQAYRLYSLYISPNSVSQIDSLKVAMKQQLDDQEKSVLDKLAKELDKQKSASSSGRATSSQQRKKRT
jgi:hypothetical protein